MIRISDSEFGQFQRFIFETAGITLSEAKKALVSGRLAKRLHACNVKNYGEYFRLLTSGQSPRELQMAVDLLTTNETYFFREPKHFQFLKKVIEARGTRSGPPRIWSAAGSTGEEAYSIAMLLEDCLPGQAWDVLASDISTRVLERARAAHYSMERIANFPPGYLQRFCLKGLDSQEGTMLVDPQLRNRVRFMQVNLNAPLPQIGTFDVVFLRNVLIYFNMETKRKVVQRVVNNIKPGGFLFIGHSESLIEVSGAVELVEPAIYQKPK
ncbi:MAG TPA: CheR family methyltransferase [Steroidobacteraceae bacterium]|nr:CheR family methyltransferase [Steroidobacteraceae bacterium]